MNLLLLIFVNLYFIISLIKSGNTFYDKNKEKNLKFKLKKVKIKK